MIISSGFLSLLLAGFDRVGSAIGPAFLAINALGGLGGNISPFEAATVGFGAFMVSR